MISTSYLQNRNGKYHLRVRIPSDLSSLLPQTEIVKSLKTTNMKIAKVSSLPYLQGISQTFSLLRSSFITPDQAQKRLESLLERRERKPTAALNVSLQVSESSPTAPPAATLSTVITSYLSDKEHGWSDKTKMESKGVYRLLKDLLGDVPTDSIDRGKVRGLRDNLLKLPANVYKIHPDHSPLEVLQLIDEGKLLAVPMSLTTVNKHISYLSSLMIHCMNEGLRKDNPASSMKIKQKRRADEERKAYDIEDIQKLSKALPRDKNKPERLWVPLICMLSGMRLEEACQLYKEDIVRVGDVWCFDVNDSKDKKLKNQSSKRIIPIHPYLLSQGLLDHVSECSEDGRLWDNLKWCKVSGYSNSVGKWYQRFNRDHVTQDKLKTFHSLRHAFADCLKQQGIQKELISELMGHSQDSITMSRYGKRYKPEVLLEVVMKVDYGR